WAALWRTTGGSTEPAEGGAGAGASAGAAGAHGVAGGGCGAEKPAAAPGKVPPLPRWMCPRVAVVTMAGAIVQGPVRRGGVPANGPTIDATTVAVQLERLARDPMVKAVVVRVNSPGGSALGSDTIHRALTVLRESGKVIVVSMGDVAASGGMFIAAAAQRVVAQPGTLTGSIGVVTGKFNVSGLLTELGVSTDSVKIGANVDMLSATQDLRPEQTAQIEALTEVIYTDFVRKVAAGRGKTEAEVRAIAKGKVYTGQQALEIGLVDQLGGLAEAVDAAKAAAGLPAGLDDVTVFDFPPRKMTLLLRLAGAAAAGQKDAEGEEGGGNGGMSMGGGSGAVAAFALGLLGGGAASAGPASGITAIHGAQLPVSARRLAGVVDGVLTRAAALDGQAAMYSFDADVLSAVTE
ncbi:hypothetical protein FOA52_003017, partial [Chlamydomonas sp. UWO 241]